MKKIIIALVAFFVFMPTTFAASASINVTVSRSSLIVGNTVRAYVTVTSSSNLGAWEFDLKYDSSKLRLSSSSYGGTYIVDAAPSSTTKKSKTYTFDFIATASGTARIYAANSHIVSWDEVSMSTTHGSRTVSIMTQAQLEASYSKNNYLKSLSVEGVEITPEFNKETLEYTVTLEPETTKITLSGEVEDSKSKVTGLGEKDVTDGENKLEVVVTAENGSQRVYVVNATVEELNPITVSISGTEYTIIRKSDQFECPNLFTEKVINYEEEDVATCYNEKSELTIVPIRNEEGEAKFFVLDSLTEYKQITSGRFIFYSMPFPEEIEDDKYNKVKLKIGDFEVDSYRLVENRDFNLIYGMNVETGEEGIYRYDSKEDTIQRHFESEEKEESFNYLFLTIALGVTTVLLLISNILFITQLNQIKKKVQKKVESYKKQSDTKPIEI